MDAWLVVGDAVGIAVVAVDAAIFLSARGGGVREVFVGNRCGMEVMSWKVDIVMC